MPPEGKVQCYYCDTWIRGGGCSSQGDHFPIPANAGGTHKVPCCQLCHDMKDLYTLERWPKEWMAKVMADFPKLNRETKIFLAKCMRMMAEHLHDVGEKFPSPFE